MTPTRPCPDRPRRQRAAAALLALGTVAALAGIAFSAPASGSKKPPVDPAVRAVLERMEQAQGQVTSFKAKVTETRRLAVLEKPEILRGEFAFESPGKMRWDYREPEQRTYVLTEGRVIGWIPAQNRVEKMDVKRREARLRRMFAIGQGADALLKDFAVTLAPQSALPQADELVLVPESRRMRKRVAEIRMWVDKGNDLPKQIRLVTGEGDSVEFALSSVQVNPKLATDAFTVTIPKGAKEVRGISGLSIFGNAADEAEAAEDRM
ncbi:MAG: outer membrane lipoprotein carrier protein LolA [Acidobacteria bacterium]|jgi:outer membrane lipoprotein carrier protein|nr:outer membrane lipoprotein carrier protein LolA [Acidobacteriota bacterium]